MSQDPLPSMLLYRFLCNCFEPSLALFTFYARLPLIFRPSPIHIVQRSTLPRLPYSRSYVVRKRSSLPSKHGHETPPFAQLLYLLRFHVHCTFLHWYRRQRGACNPAYWHRLRSVSQHKISRPRLSLSFAVPFLWEGSKQRAGLVVISWTSL